MKTNFKFLFNSNSLIVYFVASAVGFFSLFYIIWSISIQQERTIAIQNDEQFLLHSVEASISLLSQKLQVKDFEREASLLLNNYLDFMFEHHRIAPDNLVSQIDISVVNPNKVLIGSWNTDAVYPQECKKTSVNAFHPETSKYAFVIEMTINICSQHGVDFFDFNTMLPPMLLSLAVILIWGICIVLMMRSVRHANYLLGSSGTPAKVQNKIEKISWIDVRNLAQKAIELRGKSLKYYQGLILDTQHDLSKILDSIDRSKHQHDVHNEIAVVRGILQKLVSDIRANELPEEFSGHLLRELSFHEISHTLKICLKDLEIRNHLPETCMLTIKDVSTFERVLVNLASNALKHGIDTPEAVCELVRGNTLRVSIISRVSFLKTLQIFFAQMTGRINTDNPETAVYAKLMGRTGRGLNIVKKGVFRLGGKMYFRGGYKHVLTAVEFPAVLKKEISATQPYAAELPKEQKRVIFFENKMLLNEAINCGLADFFVSKAVLDQMIANKITLEIVSDVEIDVPLGSSLKLITKPERIKGLAFNWLKDTSV